MSKKSVELWHVSAMKLAAVEIITDPAEIAAMEEVRKRLRRKKSAWKAPLRIAPVQLAVVENVTDPAEIAAMEEMRHRLKRKKSGPKAKGKSKDAKAASKSAAERRK